MQNRCLPDLIAAYLQSIFNDIYRKSAIVLTGDFGKGKRFIDYLERAYQLQQ
jgi:hypothetical protein